MPEMGMTFTIAYRVRLSLSATDIGTTIIRLSPQQPWGQQINAEPARSRNGKAEQDFVTTAWDDIHCVRPLHPTHTPCL